MPSPPKPWERVGLVSNNTTSSMSAPASPASIASSTTAVENTTNSNGASAPAIPARPSSITQPFASTSTALAPGIGTNAYSSLYSSPYSRLGSTYSPFGTGYGGYGTSYGGGYGGSYGGYGSSMYGGMGYGGMGYPSMGYGGAGMPGMMGMGMDPSQTLTAQISNTTQQTFALLHNIVQTFGGFAQMLESTFMATHSSFFAMVGVIDQFAALRDVLGQVLGVFGLVRWVRGVLRGEGLAPRGQLAEEFNAFVTRPPGAPVPAPGAPKPSKKPIIIFLLAIFGIPYLMHRLIKRLAERPPVLPGPGMDPTQQLSLSAMASGEQLDPSKLTFAHALYPFEATSPQELALKKGDIVAVLMVTDPVTGSLETQWWRGRTRDGREGWFPKDYVEVIKKKVVEEATSNLDEKVKRIE